MQKDGTLKTRKNLTYMMNPLIFGLGGQEILFIALIVLILFGGKKIPELMKGLGKGVKSFKDGMNGTDNDQNADTSNPQK